MSVSVSSCGKYVATGSGKWKKSGKISGKICLFNREGKLLWSNETKGAILRISVSSDGSYGIAITFNGKVYFLYLFTRDGKLIDAGEDYCDVTSISSDGKSIAKGSSKDDRIWFRREDLQWRYKTGGYVFSLSVSPDGEYVAAGSGDRVQLFNREGKLLWSYNIGG